MKIGKNPYSTSPATVNNWIVVLVSGTPANTASFASAVIKPAANIAGIIGLTIPDSNEISFSTGFTFLGVVSVSRFSSINCSLILTPSPSSLHVSSKTSSTIPPNTIWYCPPITTTCITSSSFSSSAVFTFVLSFKPNLKRVIQCDTSLTLSFPPTLEIIVSANFL